MAVELATGFRFRVVGYARASRSDVSRAVEGEMAAAIYVPRHLIDRPKMGIAVPIYSRLRRPLRDWAEALPGPKRLAADGLLRVEPVRYASARRLAGAHNWQYSLWTLLMLRAWREQSA